MVEKIKMNLCKAVDLALSRLQHIDIVGGGGTTEEASLRDETIGQLMETYTTIISIGSTSIFKSSAMYQKHILGTLCIIKLYECCFQSISF